MLRSLAMSGATTGEATIAVFFESEPPTRPVRSLIRSLLATYECRQWSVSQFQLRRPRARLTFSESSRLTLVPVNAPPTVRGVTGYGTEDHVEHSGEEV